MTAPDARRAAEALASGDLRRARRIARAVLREREDDALAWRILGAANASAGELPAARQALERCLELDPGQGEVDFEIARVDLAAGRRDQAADHFRRAAELAGGPDLLVQAGEGLGNLGCLPDAELCFRRALEVAPGFPKARFNLALARLAAGDAERGRALLTELVGDEPDIAPAWLHLGGALNALGRYQQAIEAFEKALEVAPGNPRALTWLGASLQFLGEFDAAERRYREALRHAPDFTDAHTNLGKLLQAQGRSREAETHLHHALKIAPDHVEATSGLAVGLDNLGRYEEALELLEKRSEIRGAYQLAPIHARVLRHLNRPAEARKVLEHAAASGGLPADAGIQLQFSLAAVADELGDYAAAWEHAERANRNRRKLLPVGAPEADLRAVESAVAGLKAVFSERNMGVLPSSDNVSERPVFVVGMPRTGKSLAEQILCSHPSVHGAGELTALGDVSATIAAAVGAWPEGAPRVSGMLLNEQAASYLEALERAAGPGALRVTDTMPFNFVHLGLIHMLFPRARIIHCARHPMDLVLRCYFKNFAGRSLSFAFDLDDIVRYYQAYRELMEHWTEVLPVPVHVLRYESLVQDPERETARLLDFLELPWDPGCLRFHEPGVATSAADTPVRRPLDDREVGGWLHYRPQLDPLAGQLRPEEYGRGDP